MRASHRATDRLGALSWGQRQQRVPLLRSGRRRRSGLDPLPAGETKANDGSVQERSEAVNRLRQPGHRRVPLQRRLSGSTEMQVSIGAPMIESERTKAPHAVVINYWLHIMIMSNHRANFVTVCP